MFCLKLLFLFATFKCGLAVFYADFVRLLIGLILLLWNISFHCLPVIILVFLLLLFIV